MDKKNETLAWLVEFANMNLDEIKPGDKAKLLVESKEYLFPHQEKTDFQGASNKKGAGILAKVMSEMGFEFELPEFREARIEMKWAFEDPAIDSVEYWKKIIQLQHVVKSVLSILSDPPHANMVLPYKIQALGMLQWGPEKQPFRTTYFPLTGTQADYIILKLIRLLDGLPSHSIRLCPGCGKYFFNPSLRNKNFCSPRCMWKVGAQKKRETLKGHPQKYEAYLKKQRMIMKKRYEEKKKTELGPYVKVGRKR